MSFIRWMSERAEVIVSEATTQLEKCHKGSNEPMTSPSELGGELAALYELTCDSVAERQGGIMVAWGEEMAKEHFSVGHKLHHAQSLVNALESSLWKHIFDELDPADYADALGLSSTALGLAKDALARTYVSLASQHKVEALDMRALFAGTSYAEEA